MFSERFQKHLEAQSKIFADKTTKMRSNEALKQRKQSIFDDLPCANGGHSASCTPVLPPCLSFALPHFTFLECHFTFSGVPALKVFSCAGETWEFWLLSRRKTSGFRSVSETQPSEKSTEKHHGSIVSGIPEAFEHLPKPGDAWLLLKNGSKCCTNASHNVRVATRKLRICRSHLDHHECVLFSLDCSMSWSECSSYSLRCTNVSQRDRKMQQRNGGKCCLQTSLAARNAVLKFFGNHEMVHWSFALQTVCLTHTRKRKTSDDGMQVAISKVLRERSRLPLWALCWASLSKACSCQSPQREEKTDFEASSPSPPSVHAIDAKSTNFGHFASTISFPEAKGNQITEVQGKCCPTRPWTRKMVKKPVPKKGGPETRQPPKIYIPSL